MKKSDLKKAYTSKKAFRGKLLTSLKKALKIGAEPKVASDLQVSGKGLSQTFLTYDELRKVNAQLLKMEGQRAEAIRLIHEKRRFL